MRCHTEAIANANVKAKKNSMKQTRIPAMPTPIEKAHRLPRTAAATTRLAKAATAMPASRVRKEN